MHFGGDTACIEIRAGDTLLILDAGTGIRKLGASLMTDPEFIGKGYIFLSHSHWDHIQGFPFFRPAFVEGNEFIVHGAFKADKRLKDALRGQMGSIYFPIALSEMPGSLHFVELLEEDVRAGNLMVRSRSLNHPGGCFGYRITDGVHVVAYCTDTEPYGNTVDEKVLELAKGADIFIYDAQFTPEEYASNRQGWGHSTWQEAVKLAHECNAGTLVLFHHDPYHDDRMISDIVDQARVFFPNTIGASRELTLNLGSGFTNSPDTIFRELVEFNERNERACPTTGNDLNVVPRRIGNAIVITVPRDLSLFNSDGFHSKAMEAIADARPIRVLLDLSRLNFIDSSGIGSLASLNEACAGLGISISLCNVSERILEVLKVTRINLIMEVHDTIESALKGQGKSTTAKKTHS